jgi:hypothetical protein
MDWRERHLLFFFKAAKGESASPFRIISETKNSPPFPRKNLHHLAFYEVDSSVLTEIFS